MKSLRVLTILLVCLAGPALLFAQEGSQQSSSQQQSVQQQDTQDLQQFAARRLSEINGNEIVAEGAEISGTIQDIVFATSGEITHLVIEARQAAADTAAEGEEGGGQDEDSVTVIGETGRYLVPIEQVTFAASDEERTVLQLDESGLSALQELEDDQLPADLFSGQAVSAQYVLGSTFKDYKFVSPEGEEIGGVDDLMLNLQDKSVSYIGLGSGGFLGIGGKTIAIPVEEIVQLDTEEKQIVTNISKEQIEETEGLQGDWPAEAPALLSASQAESESDQEDAESVEDDSEAQLENADDADDAAEAEDDAAEEASDSEESQSDSSSSGSGSSY